MFCSETLNIHRSEFVSHYDSLKKNVEWTD